MKKLILIVGLLIAPSIEAMLPTPMLRNPTLVNTWSNSEASKQVGWYGTFMMLTMFIIF